jgi:hypothetical protein
MYALRTLEALETLEQSKTALTRYEVQTVTLSVSPNYQAGRTQVVDNLPDSGLVRLASVNAKPLEAGENEYELTFEPVGGYIGLVAVSSRPTPLPIPKYSTLCLVVSDRDQLIGRVQPGKSTTYKVIVPPCSLVKIA